MDEDKFIERANFAKVNFETVKRPSGAIQFASDVEESDYRF